MLPHADRIEFHETLAVVAATLSHGRLAGNTAGMVTCFVRYEIVPGIALVNASGGTHHGYFLPSEGASDVALALFTFPSFAAYEQYRARFGVDPDFVAADRIRDESQCVVRYERSFFRPLLAHSE
jgi:hypothetical protein